jgi:hypothetical protein
LRLDYLVVLARHGGNAELEARFRPSLLGDHPQPGRLPRAINRD